MPAGSATVSHDALATTAPHTQLELQVTRAVDPARSFAFSTVTIASDTGRDRLGASSLTTELDGSVVRLTRDTETGDPLELQTTTVELSP